MGISQVFLDTFYGMYLIIIRKISVVAGTLSATYL